MSFCNVFHEQDEPVQSDFCSLDFCDDLGFPGSEVSADTESSYQHDAAIFSSILAASEANQQLTQPTSDVHEIDPLFVRLSEERLRSKEIRRLDDHTARVREETTLSFGSRGSTLYSHDPFAYDWNANFGGHEKCQAKSKVSAYEDLCSFYEECTSPSEFDTVYQTRSGESMSEVDHPLDIAWLSDRCDGDLHLLVAVLETFCEQGGTHCSEIRSAAKRGDVNKLCFHTDFLLGSARNVGARELERRAEALAAALRPRPDAAHAEPAGGAELSADFCARAEAVVVGFEEVSAFWKVGVRAAQGGTVHPLERDAPHAEWPGPRWARSGSGSFKLSMALLHEYLRGNGGGGAWGAAGGRSVDGEEGQEDDEATEPSERGGPGGPRWGGGSGGSDGGRGDSDDSDGERGSDDSDGADGGGGGDMAGLFGQVRGQLEGMRRSHHVGRADGVRALAEEVARAAGAQGCRGIAAKARAIAAGAADTRSAAAGTDYVLSSALDELELQIDSAEAIWKSSGWIV